jgi:hypothetical protein
MINKMKRCDDMQQIGCRRNPEAPRKHPRSTGATKEATRKTPGPPQREQKVGLGEPHGAEERDHLEII